MSDTTPPTGEHEDPDFEPGPPDRSVDSLAIEPEILPLLEEDDLPEAEEPVE